VSFVNGTSAYYSCESYTTFANLKKAVMQKFFLNFEYFSYYHIYEQIQKKDKDFGIYSELIFLKL
jgi:hypothetical protein